MMNNSTDLPYRPCVGFMMLNPEGKVFVAKRIDTMIEAWQMPQGGIDEGESPLDALFREMEEEIGTRNAVILQEHDDWLQYDLPEHLIGTVWGGKYRGQKMKWYLMRFQGQDSDIDINTANPEFTEWKWLEMSKLPQSAVAFKRPLYEQIVASFSPRKPNIL